MNNPVLLFVGPYRRNDSLSYVRVTAEPSVLLMCRQGKSATIAVLYKYSGCKSVSSSCLIYGGEEGCIEGFWVGGDPEGESPTDRHKHRREDIKMDFKDIISEVVDWIYLTQDRDIECGNEPSDTN
jgi:hypothetical protein